MQLLEAFDTRIRGRDDIVALLSVPPLAVIPWLARAKS
jgi:capsular polysaccharide biosynthesis protein